MGNDLDIANSLPLLLQGCVFIAMLVLASAWDIHKRIIPDTMCLCIAMSGLIAFDLMNLFGILISLPLLLAALLWDGMGGGDIKLMAAAGLVLGLQKSMAAMIMGLTAMLVFHAIYTLIQRLRGRDAPKAYPLAPFLSLGCLAVYFLI